MHICYGYINIQIEMEINQFNKRNHSIQPIQKKNEIISQNSISCCIHKDLQREPGIRQLYFTLY